MTTGGRKPSFWLALSSLWSSHQPIMERKRKQVRIQNFPLTDLSQRVVLILTIVIEKEMKGSRISSCWSCFSSSIVYGSTCQQLWRRMYATHQCFQHCPFWFQKAPSIIKGWFQTLNMFFLHVVDFDEYCNEFYGIWTIFNMYWV